MADETMNMPDAQAAGGERVGFCQDCGRPLTAATIKTVGSGVFCEPCLERRLAGGAVPGYGAASQNPYAGQAPNPGAWQNTAAGYPPPPPVPPPPPMSLNTPSPALAGFLGLIPGVGAMYNGQFAKGVVHLVVFAILVSLSDNINGIFGLFVAGWVFFMAFEAYHTARARRDGLPLPDPFGWNNIGERMGFGKNWGFVNTSPAGTPPPPPAGVPYTGPVSTAGTDWVGYVSPSDFAATTPPPPGSVPYVAPAPVTDPLATQPVMDPSYTQVPYTSPAPYPASYASMPPVMDPLPPARRFPVGAIWLIGLGVLFLVGNISPSLQFSWRWLIPLLLAFLSVWLFMRRLGFLRRGNLPRPALGSVICGLRAPVVLLTLAILFALQSAYVFTIGQTWPVLIIVLGAMLILERTVGRGYPAPGVPPAPPYTPGDVPASRWAATTEPIHPTQSGQ